MLVGGGAHMAGIQGRAAVRGAQERLVRHHHHMRSCARTHARGKVQMRKRQWTEQYKHSGPSAAAPHCVTVVKRRAVFSREMRYGQQTQKCFDIATRRQN